MSSALEQLVDELQKHAENWPGGAQQEHVDLYFSDLQLRSERPKIDEQLDSHKELIAEYTSYVRNPPEDRTEELTAERDDLKNKKENFSKVIRPSTELTAKHTSAFLDYLGKGGDELAKDLAARKRRITENKVAIEGGRNWLNNISAVKKTVEDARAASSANADLKQEITALKRELEAGTSIASPSVDEEA